jgi:hypothetical protein
MSSCVFDISLLLLSDWVILWPLNNGTDGLGGGKNQRMKERAKEKWE